MRLSPYFALRHNRGVSSISAVRSLLALIAIALASTAAQAAGDPFAARVRYDDVDRFYRVYDMAHGRPSAAQLRHGYLETGSIGVRDFVPNRIVSSKALAAKIAGDRPMYERTRLCRAALPHVERRLRAAYLAFQTALPEAELPDTTILIGRGNSGGTTSPTGVLIGLEVVCDPAAGTVPLDMRLFHLVAHELAHTQQATFRGDTLLAAALNEGVAEFVGELISGAPANSEMFAKALVRAPEIERAFAAEMNGAEIKRWLYNGPGTNAWPGDLAYWVGYRIAKSYYDRVPDKRAAVRTMLKSTDAKAFLTESGWAPAAELMSHQVGN